MRNVNSSENNAYACFVVSRLIAQTISSVMAFLEVQFAGECLQIAPTLRGDAAKGTVGGEGHARCKGSIITVLIIKTIDKLPKPNETYSIYFQLHIIVICETMLLAEAERACAESDD